MFFKLTPEEIDKAFQDKNLPGPYDDKYVSLVNINKVYDNKFHAVYDFNIDIKKKEFIVFVGPSGCGKSTTLRMIAGLEDISSGDLFINGERCNDLLSKDRDVAMVFQNYALYPNMTVYKNMAFALKVRHFPKKLIDERVRNAAKILEIEDQLKKKPKELSGGQRQRVALGRAIVRNARIFLMDEPLSNLDAKLRVQMRAEIIRLHKKLNATTIYVTHDQTEAMTMADRIVVMKLGVVQQIDTPIEIYRHPSNKFVASFIGSPSMNFINGTYDNGKVIFKTGEQIKLNKEQIRQHDLFYKALDAKESSKLKEFYKQLELEKQQFEKKKNTEKVKKEFEEKYNKLKKDKENLMKELKRINKGEKHDIIFGIRPEAITQVKASKGNKDNIFIREVKLSELLGDEYFLHFDYAGQDLLSKIISEKLIVAGTKIALQINKEKIHLFDVNTEITIC